MGAHPGEFVETPVYGSEKLMAGNVIAGPAIIEVPTSTTVIPRNHACRVDGYGNHVLARDMGAHG